MGNSRFQKGSGVYKCSDCEKQTRETGNGESSLGYCATCLEAAEAYNAVQDGDMSEEEFNELLKQIGYEGKDFGRSE